VIFEYSSFHYIAFSKLLARRNGRFLRGTWRWGRAIGGQELACVDSTCSCLIGFFCCDVEKVKMLWEWNLWWQELWGVSHFVSTIRRFESSHMMFWGVLHFVSTKGRFESSHMMFWGVSHFVSTKLFLQKEDSKVVTWCWFMPCKS
jgi:hypothetical protein